MYSSGYSQVSKYSPPAQKKMAYRTKGKSCGYYMRIIFFFSSLIQSLIIVSLVLFLIYGKKQDSASTSRIQDLEESFTRLSIENVALRQQRRNLTTLLNSTTTEKARNEWDLAQLRHICNISLVVIQDMDRKLQSCNGELFFCKSAQRLPGQCPSTTQDRCNCGVFTEHLQAKLQLENSNFTQTTQRMRMEMDQITKDRDNLHLEVIRLRREQFTHEKEVEFLRHRCKDEFSVSLSGVSNVTKAFLEKIESLFPSHIAFQISCPKQREHLEQIRTNCTTLSKEVEDKFQSYLNNVGQQVSSIISENSGLKAENLRLSEDYRKCTHNRTGLIEQHKRDIRMMQDKHGKDVEKLLVDKMKLIGENEVLTKSAEYRTKEAEHLANQLKQLNMSCMPRNGFSGLPRTSNPSGWGLSSGGGGSSSSASSSSGIGQTSKIGSSSSLGLFGSTFNKQVSAGPGSSSSSGASSSTGSLFNRLGSTGTGSSSSSLSSSGTSSSTGSLFNKLGSTGTGSSSSSLSSSGTSSSTGSLFNKLGSTGTGSSSSSLSSFGSSSSTGSLFSKLGSTGTGSSSTSLSSSGSSSSTGSQFNKPGSTGGAFSSFGSVGSNPSLSSSGTGLNKPTLSGRGSSTTGLSSGSSGSSPSISSSGIGLNKPTSSVKSSSGFGSSSGSTGSTNKSGSSSPGFSWLGFGNSNSGQSKTGSGTGKGTSSTGTGSTFGGGRTSGLGGGSGVSVTQHLQDLQRLINPASPEERQDLSRVLG